MRAVQYMHTAPKLIQIHCKCIAGDSSDGCCQSNLAFGKEGWQELLYAW